MIKSTDYHYLDSLNDQQRAAVEYKDGPALVIAGAGSGKTRVLTYKIVDLLRNGYEPYRLLALTFTNKAAREMKERITAIVGEQVAARLWMGTFHSIFLRILRKHAAELGFKSGFTIYDTADSRSLIKSIIKEMELDEKKYKPAAIAAAISNAKNAMITHQLYLRDTDNYNRDKKAGKPLTGEIYSRYCERCRVANAMDFDDILLYMNILLRDFPDIKRHYQEFFKYILVDEYQDTNFAQHLIISQLSEVNSRICVVGDDAQSIYSFRGADISNILNLEKRYKGLRIFKLERNYRSTQNIIDAAGSLIAKNTRQMKKNVYSENAKGDPVEVIKTYSDLEEAFLVANLIGQSKLQNHDSYDDYAILYRTNAQSRAIEESLRKRNIPYRIYGGLSFYQRKEVKDMVSYFRLSVNPDDDEALKRIINYPARGIGDTTLRKLQAAATLEQKSMWDTINSSDLKAAGLNAGTIKKLSNFAALIQEFIDDNAGGSNAYELAQLIYNRTGILTSLAHDNTPESISRQENLSEILAGLKEFVDIREQTGEGDPDMRSFLSEVMLATDQDQNDPEDAPKVTMLTVHAAKGLEFKHVFIVGVEEDLFPSAMSQESLAQIEEERRLLYVAITRAQDTCTITYAGSRFRNGQTVMTNPSRFLSDIDTRYLKLNLSGKINGTPSPFVKPGFNTPKRTPAPTAFATQPQRQNASLKKISTLAQSVTPGDQAHRAADLAVGMAIEHTRFGKGKITTISQMSGEDVITVDFGVVGVKKLLLKFAKFNII